MTLRRSAKFRLFRRPAEVEKRQGDAAKRLFSLGSSVCALRSQRALAANPRRRDVESGVSSDDSGHLAPDDNP
jgi:hypothetical protein